MTKTGTEKPKTAITIVRRSIQEPAFQAASTPRGIETRTAMMMVVTESARVGSRRCLIRVATGRLEKIEMPRSPCSSCQTHLPNWM